MKRRGNVLIENLFFIILNFVFLTILILFIYSQMSSEGLIEKKYSKQIALAIDSAKPVMEIQLDMKDAWKKTEANGFSFNDVVKISGNVVTVRVSAESKGNSYSFFNNVDAHAYALNSVGSIYVIKINSYN